MNEFKRASKRERSEAGGSKTPEILDVDTLMSLDEFQETNKSKFRNIKEIKEFEKEMKKIIKTKDFHMRIPKILKIIEFQ